MKKYRNLIFYISVMVIFLTIIYFIINLGQSHFGSILSNNTNIEGRAWLNFLNHLKEDIVQPTAILILQIVVILLAVRIFGWICKKIGQPTVVGEIIAGVVLGPSLLGLYFPHIFDFIFPASSLSNISFLSQIGLILFMFIVGMELNLRTLKNKANDALIISHSSIAVTFTIGVCVAYFLFSHFNHSTNSFLPFALFMGIAMSIAAFPVMARIIHERGINKSHIGPTIITCAAIDDITAWCLLASVIAIAKAGSMTSSLFVILLATLYIFVMFKIVRPFLQRIADMQTSKHIINKSIIGVFFIVLFLSAYATEIIGIHALFGAFLAGVIMPSNVNFRNMFSERIEDVALIILLPLFFVFTGLRTQIGLINEPYMWLICISIILLAVTGKSMGSALAARYLGYSWKDSLTIGALMDTRGLMELVVLNIGLDLGILTPEIFAMMVIMALATTFLTSPLLSLIDKIFKKKDSEEKTVYKKFRILVSFDNPEMGNKLLFIANSFIKKRLSNSELTMLHLSEGNILYQYGIQQEEEDVFKSIMTEADSIGQTVIPMFEITNNIPRSVAKIANKGEYDLLLIGTKEQFFIDGKLDHIVNRMTEMIHIPKFLLYKLKIRQRKVNALTAPVDKMTRKIVSKTDIPVGIFIDKDAMGVRNVFVPILDDDDIFMGDFMERLASNSYVRITLWDPIGLSDNSIDFIKAVRAIKSVNPYLFQLWNNNIPIDSDIIKKQDLVMISLNSWRKMYHQSISWIKDTPSTIVLNN